MMLCGVSVLGCLSRRSALDTKRDLFFEGSLVIGDRAWQRSVHAAAGTLQPNKVLHG